MARLPIPGGDINNWDNILNQYLSVSLNADGTINMAAILSALSSSTVAFTITDTSSAGILIEELGSGGINIYAASTANVLLHNSIGGVVISSGSGNLIQLNAGSQGLALNSNGFTALSGIDGTFLLDRTLSGPAGSGGILIAAGFASVNNNQTTPGNIVIDANNAVLIESSTLGFFGGTGVAKPTVTGSKGGNAALASLMSALSTLGLVTDSTT